MSDSDRSVIELRGLRVVAVHGALEEEKSRAQPFELDIDVTLGPGAGRGDAIENTVDYGQMASLAVEVVTRQTRNLLESVASDVADVLLEQDSVVSATVVVRKLRPPVPLDLASAAVRVTKTRD